MHSISSDAGAKDEGKFMDSTENSGFCQRRKGALNAEVAPKKKTA